jgi:hypothetical protein
MATKAVKAKAVKPTPLCPECGSPAVVPVIHGIPSDTQNQAIAAGQAIRADREEWEGMSEWYCNACGCDWSRHSRRFKKAGGINATRSDR